MKTMKKIITLFIAVAIFAGAQAQSTEDAKRVILGQRKGNNSGQDPRDIFGTSNERRVYEENGNRNYPYGSREAEIDRVNREYDYKIQSIRNNGTLSYSEKERIIRDLNNQRQRSIKEISRGSDRNYNNRNNNYDKNRNKKYKDRDDDDDDDDRRYRSNNGKNGWSKSKGNKKGYRDRDDD
jgi:hypothetical protein